MSRVGKVLLLWLGSSVLYADADLERTHQLSPLHSTWIYVRASEASTLFIEEKNKGKEVFCEVQLTARGGPKLVEFHPGEEISYPIESIRFVKKEIIITYQGGIVAPEKTLIYPFRDVDETWILIHFWPGEGDNEMRFMTPKTRAGSLEYLNEE